MFSEEEIGPWTSSLWQLIRCGISEDVKDIRMPIKYKNTRLTWETGWFFSLMLILGIFLLFPQLHLAECSVWRECTAPVWAGVALWMSWCSCRWGKGFLLVHQECQRAAPAVDRTVLDLQSGARNALTDMAAHTFRSMEEEEGQSQIISV